MKILIGFLPKEGLTRAVVVIVYTVRREKRERKREEREEERRERGRERRGPTE
jgi:hypothetical protein